MPLRTPLRASVSTWALQPLLQSCYPGRPGDPTARLFDAPGGSIDLLEVPALLSSHGFHTMELCHFHVPSTTPEYLGELRRSLEAAQVSLWSVLIDDGDITHPEHGDRDCEWIEQWIRNAASLGSRCVRVIGGRQPRAIDVAIRQFDRLTAFAESNGIRVLTENWFETMSSPEPLIQALGALEGRLGLCFDFGNWGGASKYEDLSQIARFADSCHAKCHYESGQPNAEDFQRCVEITRTHGFEGPYTLVYGEPGSE